MPEARKIKNIGLKQSEKAPICLRQKKKKIRGKNAKTTQKTPKKTAPKKPQKNTAQNKKKPSQKPSKCKRKGLKEKESGKRV